MIYLFTFFLCVLSDKKDKSKGQLIHRLFLLWIFVFLCFGYMTGSDWRSYELIYSSERMLSKYEDSEFGFVYLVRFFNLFISDFWIFAGIMKILYLDSLRRFFSCLIPSVWTAIGFSFGFGSIFILIDCPMRFMVGQTVLFYSSLLFFNGKIKIFCLVGLISIFFHSTMIIPYLFLLSSLFCGFFSKINRLLLLCIYFFIVYFSLRLDIYDFIFESLLNLQDSSLTNLSQKGSFYSKTSFDYFYTLGFLKNVVLFVLILYYRDIIVSQSKHGKLLFYLSCLFFLTNPILSVIPTAFRLGVFIGYFSVASFVLILVRTSNMNFKFITYILFSVILLKDVYSSWVYFPYTNSLPYIVFGHLHYEVRSRYNYIEYPLQTGNEIK